MGFFLKYLLAVVCIILTVIALFISIRSAIYNKSVYLLEYGKPADSLFLAINKWVPIIKKGIVGVYIFNNRPSVSQIEDINILSSKRTDANLFVLLKRNVSNRYTSSLTICSITSRSVYCKYNDSLLKKNYFLLFKDGILIYGTEELNLRTLNQVILKALYPNKSVSDYFYGHQDYMNLIKARLMNNKALDIYDLQKKEYIPMGTIIDRYPLIYFINAKCSECELRNILPIIFDDHYSKDAACILFSVYGNRAGVNNIINEKNANLNIYLDLKDHLDLLDRIINKMDNSIQIYTHDLIH